MDGKYEIKVKKNEDDDNDNEEEAEKAPKHELVWHPKTTIANSAELVNSV